VKRDRELTEAAHFLDSDSFVFKDGREWLVGKDWEARKFELWKRCGGRCEWVMEIERTRLPNGPTFRDTIRCSALAEHPHHILKKSVAHDDRLANLQGLCFLHHQAAHPEKQLMSGKVTA
jgi:hypothetical protein